MLTLSLMFFQYISFENTVRRKEIARNEQFLLFSQCFLPFRRIFCHVHQILKCLQTLSVWKSLKFVVWKRVNCLPAWSKRLFKHLIGQVPTLFGTSISRTNFEYKPIFGQMYFLHMHGLLSHINVVNLCSFLKENP